MEPKEGVESKAILSRVSAYAAVEPFTGSTIPAATAEDVLLAELDAALLETELEALLLVDTELETLLLAEELELDAELPPLFVETVVSELSEDDPPPHAASTPANVKTPAIADIRYNIMILLLFCPVSRTGLFLRLPHGQFAFTPEHQLH